MKAPVALSALAVAVATALVLWRNPDPPPAPAAHVELPVELPTRVELAAVTAPPAAQVQHRPTPAERRQGWVEPPPKPPLAAGLAGKLSFVPGRPSKGSLPDSFAALEQAAATSDRAAEELHQALNRCRYRPKTPDELRAMEARVRESYAKTGGVVVGEYVGTLDEQLVFLQSAYERCRDIDPGLPERALELLRASADRGDWHNSLLYAQALGETDPEESRARLETLATKGSATALGSLGHYSLPHKLAYINIMIAMTGPKTSEDFLRELRKIESTTSPTEYREAEQEAARLLGNPACCKL